MERIARVAAATALGCCLISNVAHATVIQSLTIEEIGITSGGVGTSQIAGGGGWGDFIPASGSYLPSPAYFVSAGSSDGGLVMGITQGDGMISPGFNWNGALGNLNTLNGAPSGSITAGVMSLDLSGLVAKYLPPTNLAFDISPDALSLLTSVSMIDANHYFYTADWTHLVNNDLIDTSTNAILPGWNGATVIMHLEGIATLATVPEPSTAWLVGAALLGMFGARRRKPF